MNSQAVEIAGLRVQYGDATVLDDLQLDIGSSEFLCLLGPSGCGKSTLLRVMGDLATYHGGDVLVEGEPPTEAWKRLAYVFQAPRLVPWRNALDNVVLGMQFRGLPGSKGELREQAREAMRTVGIEELAQKPAHVLSGGEQQRVAIARALAVRPEVLLMDEPFSALDVQTRRQLRSEIVSVWRRTGLTIVFVTHDVDEALIVGSRIVVFSPKPTRILDDIHVDLSHPADPRSAEFQQLRQRIIARFASSDAYEELTESPL